jgi:serine/threonine protein kinase
MPKFSMTLRKLLDQKIPREKVLPLFSQVLDGIEAAHKLRVFHRDLKPENILYEADKDLIVIADFGIAHFEEDIIATAVKTKVGAKMANFAYAAPEQKNIGMQVDHRADIFALGLILNEMFTGQVPHSVGYKNIATIAPEYEYLVSLVDKMIQQNPESRPASIEEIKHDLIRRGNEFINRQKLDEKTKQVVPVIKAGIADAIKIVSVDWDNGVLKLKLNRAVEAGWIQSFQNPQGSWNAVMGSGPENFHIEGDLMSVRAREDSAQNILDFSKQYVNMANQQYQDKLNRKAIEDEQAYRNKLEQEQLVLQKKVQVISKLKL